MSERPDLSRVTKKVESYIISLERQKENLAKELDARINNEPSQFFYEVYGRDINPHQMRREYVPVNRLSGLTVDLDGEEIGISVRDGSLHLMANSGTILVKPVVSNVVDISVDSHWKRKND